MVRQHRRFQTRKKDEARGNSRTRSRSSPLLHPDNDNGHRPSMHSTSTRKSARLLSPGTRSMAPPFDLQQHP
ncbi:hypothetical protein C4K04_4848 [Pseudomonas chlororaphis]|uniref:Uncharacterized protein n=1 Tax=Pseudomonas chlororaphis TaxID=587753 RepID=A0A3G7TTT1_9PSED|nr:hypothetical protein C4K04_4848 [Pseudomonas chlororaphis]